MKQTNSETILKQIKMKTQLFKIYGMQQEQFCEGNSQGKPQINNLTLRLKELERVE